MSYDEFQELLGINIDGCPIAHHCIDLFDLPIGDRDTSSRPVPLVHRIDTLSGASVDEDVVAGSLALRFSKGNVRLVRVGDTDGQMKQAVRIAPVNGVRTLRRAPVALEPLVSCLLYTSDAADE